MTKKLPHPNWLGYLVATLGLGITMTELLLYWLRGKPINPWPMFTGATIMFLGGYLIDSSRAKDATAFVVNSAVTILGALPGGRRKTDAVVTTEPVLIKGETTGDTVTVVSGASTVAGPKDDESDGD